jgi:ABC-2 type transport system ATP-binding protein
MLPDGAHRRIPELAKLVALEARLDDRVSTYSLGMRQRLGLAQALLGDPGTLILDEPANGLDPHGIHWLRDVLKSLAAEGRTVFVSSHLLSEMELMADQLVVIGRGKMIYNGAVDGFVREFTQSTILVRSPQIGKLAAALSAVGGLTTEPAGDGTLRVTGADAATVGELAHRADVVLHELATETASLEAAFITATGMSEEYVARRTPTPGGAA